MSVPMRVGVLLLSLDGMVVYLTFHCVISSLLTLCYILVNVIQDHCFAFQLMDRYFDTPEAKFDLDIFEEAFDLLIKYNDRDGVGTFWRLMEEMGVEPPDEMREKVWTFIP